MGGGQGLGPIKQIVKSLNKLTVNFQLIVVAGVNKKLIKWMRKYHAKCCKKMIVCEYANNIEELMEVASLAITKPGGMTTAEALAKNLPMIIVKPLPGQEMRNTNFLLEHGAAVRVNKLNDIGEIVESLLHEPQRLRAMQKAAKLQSKTQSSMEIAKLIIH